MGPEDLEPGATPPARKGTKQDTGQAPFSPPAKPSTPKGGNLGETLGRGEEEEKRGSLKALEVKKLEVQERSGPERSMEKRGAGSAVAQNSFDSEKKTLFLELAAKWWPNISKIAAVVGIHRSTYYNHLNQDREFAAAIADVAAARIDKIEGVVMEAAEDPKNFLHQAMVLRAYKPELYDRAKRIQIEGYKTPTDTEAERRRQLLAGAVDAEIVKHYEDRKSYRRQQIESGSGESKADGGTVSGGEGKV